MIAVNIGAYANRFFFTPSLMFSTVPLSETEEVPLINFSFLFFTITIFFKRRE